MKTLALCVVLMTGLLAPAISLAADKEATSTAKGARDTVAVPAIPVEAPAGARVDTPEPPVDPAMSRKLVLARELVVIDGTDELARTTMDELTPLLIDYITNQPDMADLPEEDRVKLTEIILDEFKVSFMPGLVDLFVENYARNFTEEELTSLIGTFDSPVMRKYVQHSAKGDASFERASDELTQKVIANAVQRYLAWKFAETA